jgi:hypothetical protein
MPLPVTRTFLRLALSITVPCWSSMIAGVALGLAHLMLLRVLSWLVLLARSDTREYRNDTPRRQRRRVRRAALRPLPEDRARTRALLHAYASEPSES